MPRESIWASTPREVMYDGAGLYNVEVGWARERDVQVGVRLVGEQSIAAMLLGLPPHPGEGEQPLVVTYAGRDITLPGFDCLWANFDRGQVNRMIRILRRARDEAYGRDE